MEAYTCALQRVAEASVGRRWISEGGIRVPKITRVVEVFLNATGMWVPLNRIRKCWPAWRKNIPVQDLRGVRQGIVRKLDEIATHDTSKIAWDQFAFPLTDQEGWGEEVLCYRPGKTLDVRTHMPGFRLMLQDDSEQYPHAGHTLIFEGSMLVYDPQWDIAHWVPIRGTSATLTMPELHAAYDLNNFVPSPSSEFEPTRPSSTQIVKCIPGGAESDTNSSAIDSGDEWDKTEGVRALSCCSTPMSKIAPTWADVHAAALVEKVARKQAVSWEDIVSTQLPGDVDNSEAKDSESGVDPLFEDAPVEEGEYEEDVVIESVTEEELEEAVAEKLPTLKDLTKTP